MLPLLPDSSNSNADVQARRVGGSCPVTFREALCCGDELSGEPVTEDLDPTN
jgi:hypothetical protein